MSEARIGRRILGTWAAGIAFAVAAGCGATGTPGGSGGASTASATSSSAGGGTGVTTSGAGGAGGGLTGTGGGSTASGTGGAGGGCSPTSCPGADDECQKRACVNGACATSFMAVGAPCGTGLGCDGKGGCVGCADATTCPGTDGDCAQRACVAMVCGTAFSPDGTTAAQQTAGDCMKNVCDGKGGISVVVQTSDIPLDGKQCTQDVCSAAGEPSNPPVAAGMPCDSGGVVCDGNGACAQCGTKSDCGADTACRAYECTAGSCAHTDTAAGPLAAAQQMAGDCHEAQCDGAGSIINAVDDNDLPVDGNPCTGDVCTSGAPTNPNLAAGDPCNQGGIKCDGAGVCVACLSGADCASGTCAGHVCLPASCGNAAKDGAETDVDCGGGVCATCNIGKLCAVDGDCASGACAGGICACSSAGAHLVISEVRSRGLGGTSDEFVELYNPTGAPVTLDSSWTITARSDSSGTYATRWAGSAGKVIPAQGHFLVVGSAYPAAAQAKDDVLSSGVTDASSVVLKKSGAVIDALCFCYNMASCTSVSAAGYICEGTAVMNPHDNSAATSTDASLERKPGGGLGNCIDTGDSSADFATTTPANPQSSASALTP